ncbi:hypothetical protein Aab01nite_30520 [Paractinoplanes abujensis]|uniref:IPT/TIG domain-containing protein n=1 Tax=Paractinoplanes abujensis TaxID=882441 RepID=A0A7W7D0L5_9ACTN|nr:IPT/TIG domain-containing protein [Actinoplanes abujensis]MBB4698052.1 hypothetical protein [Actinoplanes abujensis]GID19462.1 hypothetical protein Aab01nite_30520 [Actinoplanes abujensis]
MTSRTARLAGGGVAFVTLTALMLAASTLPASAAALPMTLSSVTGPSGGGSTVLGSVTATSSVPIPFPAGTQPTVQFQYAACSASAQPVTQIAGTGTTLTAGVLTVDPATVKRVTTTKVLFQVPSGPYPAQDADGNPSTVNPGGLVLVGAQTSARWNVCVYDSGSTTASTLLATSSYTVAVPPTITSIIPASSPAGGGQLITVNGTGFTAAGTTVSIDGVALTDVRVAANGLSLSATTGPHAAASGLALTVSTPGGPVSSLNPDNDDTTADAPIPFAYSNGIVIAPNTAVSGSAVTLDVGGAGFSQLTFDQGGTPTSGQAHVFLVKDAYDPAANRGVAECVVLSVISDNELVCSLDLSADQLNPSDSSTVAGVPVAEGAYIVTVVASGDPAAGSTAKPTIVSSGATFTVGPY